MPDYGDNRVIKRHLNILNKIATDCGAFDNGGGGGGGHGGGGSRSAGDISDVDTTNMSAYEVKQLQIAALVQKVRANMEELDSDEKNGNSDDNSKSNQTKSKSKKAEISFAIRSDLRKLKKEASAAHKLAQSEGKKADFEELNRHIGRTEERWSSRFQTEGNANARQLAAQGGGGGVGDDYGSFINGSSSGNDMAQPMIDPREDEEFMQFFEQTKKKDIEIDQAVDRIYDGVVALHQNAKQINAELKIQDKLLQETDQKVTNTTDELRSVNKKLKETLKRVENDKMCCYLVCFLVLLGLAGVIYYIVKSNK